MSSSEFGRTGPLCAPSVSGRIAMTAGTASRHASVFCACIAFASWGRRADYMPMLALLMALLAQQPPTIRSRTTLVPVDVRVVDRDGTPVTDLKKEDFTVLENGVRQDVRFFDTHALTAEAPRPGPLDLRKSITPD